MENKNTMRPPDVASLMDSIFNPDPKPVAKGHASDVTDDQELDTPDNAPPELKLLRGRQRDALSAIMKGRGYGDASIAAGVSRKTVYNWARHDATFKAALSAWRVRMEQHAADELTAAVAVAARTFGHAAATDWRAAAVLLRQRGLLEAKAGIPADSPLAGLDALPAARRAEVERRIRDMIKSPDKEPEYMPEVRALQERMVAEEAAACEGTAGAAGRKVAEGNA
jgi:hypothetical protein